MHTKTIKESTINYNSDFSGEWFICQGGHTVKVPVEMVNFIREGITKEAIEKLKFEAAHIKKDPEFATENLMHGYLETCRPDLPANICIEFEESIAVDCMLFVANFSDCPLKEDNIKLTRLLNLKNGFKDCKRRIDETISLAQLVKKMNEYEA